MPSSLLEKIVRRWRVYWLWRGGSGFWGRQASRLAAIGAGPNRRQTLLAAMTRKGFISPRAEIVQLEPSFGQHIFIAERVVLARMAGDGPLTMHDRVQVNRDCWFELGPGGAITIGPHTTFQQGCVLVSMVEPIRIGARCQLACYCTLYSYDHGIEPGREIYTQPLTSKGPIVLGDDVWLGAGVKVMSGVRIGHGAVIGAGSVVTRDIPDHAIAAGAPCRVIRFRNESHPAQPARVPP